MKLSKRLITSGVLGNGHVRHCSELDITSLATSSRFGASPSVRLAASRRATLLAEEKKRGILFGLPAFFGLVRKK